MSPTNLREYIKVFRDTGCMSGHLKMADGTEISVTLGPDQLEGFGEVPAPGGWKSDTGALDAPFVDEERLPQ